SGHKSGHGTDPRRKNARHSTRGRPTLHPLKILARLMSEMWHQCPGSDVPTALGARSLYERRNRDTGNSMIPSVALDLTFLRRTRGHTGRNVKSAILGGTQENVGISALLLRTIRQCVSLRADAQPDRRRLGAEVGRLLRQRRDAHAGVPDQRQRDGRGTGAGAWAQEA